MEPEIIIPSADLSKTQPFGGVITDGLADFLADIFGSGIFFGDNLSVLLNKVWLTYIIVAYILCIFMLVIFVYASAGKKKLEELDAADREKRERIYEEHFKSGPKNHRIQDVLDHIASDSPSDWKLAIIEADIILDEILKEAGYAGVSLGERLRSISPNQLDSLDDAWQAHKIRNQIAHGGADFILTKQLAEDTIKKYRRVFHEFNVR
jgi:hypothetical protein